MGEAFHEVCAMAPLQFARLRPSGFRQAALLAHVGSVVGRLMG